MATDRLDPLLRPFVEASSDREADQLLSDLLEAHAVPLARRIVDRKLRSWRRVETTGVGAREKDDVVAEALATLVERLQRLRAIAGEPPIESLLN